jgi:hypothetical protein
LDGAVKMKNRISEKEKRPFFINLPKGAEKKYFYGYHDIVEQKKALWCQYPNGKTLRCSEPFTIKVTVKGKEKILESKKEK